MLRFQLVRCVFSLYRHSITACCGAGCHARRTYDRGWVARARRSILGSSAPGRVVRVCGHATSHITSWAAQARDSQVARACYNAPGRVTRTCRRTPDRAACGCSDRVAVLSIPGTSATSHCCYTNIASTNRCSSLGECSCTRGVPWSCGGSTHHFDRECSTD